MKIVGEKCVTYGKSISFVVQLLLEKTLEYKTEGAMNMKDRHVVVVSVDAMVYEDLEILSKLYTLEPIWIKRPELIM